MAGGAPTPGEVGAGMEKDGKQEGNICEAADVPRHTSPDTPGWEWPARSILSKYRAPFSLFLGLVSVYEFSLFGLVSNNKTGNLGFYMLVGTKDSQLKSIYNKCLLLANVSQFSYFSPSKSQVV